MIFREVFCGFCSTRSNQPAPPPPEVQVVPDLDTRPGKSDVSGWLQQCPECGYSAADIGSLHERATGVVGGEAFRRILDDATVPPPARRFLAHALILKEVGQLADAGWVSLQGAWVCDDLGAAEAGARCRDRAVEHWLRGRQAGQDFAEPGEDFALVSDVLRRAGRLEEALRTVNEGLACEDLPDTVEQILRFEKTLIQRRDTGTHRLSEMPAFQDRPLTK